MILRVPEYFDQFSCIAGACKDSCCLGWEIDIDDDSYDYYCQVQGELGERFKKHFIINEEGEHGFQLTKDRRCPFLNKDNLCDIYIGLGEEALSEVCTEFPRFSLEYEGVNGTVLQKYLTLSCEVVGRLLFSKEESVKFVEFEMPDYVECGCSCGADEEECDTDEYDDEIEPENVARNSFIEYAQAAMIKILQNRDKDIISRMDEYLCFAERIQDIINESMQKDIEFSEALVGEELSKLKSSEFRTDVRDKWLSYEDFESRFAPFEEMAIINQEWEYYKELIAKYYGDEDTYVKLVKAYSESEDFRENDFEQLMVYFTFRYMMNSVYNMNVLSYAKLSVCFAKVIRDMDAVRFYENGCFTKEDRMDVARIFSKEVEHSEDNVELVREEILFV